MLHPLLPPTLLTPVAAVADLRLLEEGEEDGEGPAVSQISQTAALLKLDRRTMIDFSDEASPSARPDATRAGAEEQGPRLPALDSGSAVI